MGGLEQMGELGRQQFEDHRPVLDLRAEPGQAGGQHPAMVAEHPLTRRECGLRQPPGGRQAIRAPAAQTGPRRTTVGDFAP